MIPIRTEAKDVNILDFGAVPDGKTMSTDFIQKAIDYCAATGGGTVTVPNGTYLTNTIYLKSNIDFHLQKNAVILGSTLVKEFGNAVVEGDNIENSSVTGEGVINGQGFMEYYPETGKRHYDLFLYMCRNIKVTNITLINSPSWTFRILECNGVIVQGIRINSYANVNNDGIDIDGKNVVITGCIIDSEDDAICLKSDDPKFLVENVTVSNCVISSICNAIKFGTSSRCGFKNVSISNCVIRKPSEGNSYHWSKIQGVSSDTTVISGISLEIVDGGIMDQIVISNISMTGIQTPLFIRLGNRNGIGTLKNVIISNIIAKNESMITSSITGIPGSYVENVIVKDIIFNCIGNGSMKEAAASVPEKEKNYPENRMFGYSLPAYGLYVRHVNDLILENIHFNLINPDARPAFVFDDCHNIKINGFYAGSQMEGQPLLRLIQSTNVTLTGYYSTYPVALLLHCEGEKSSNIKLLDNDFANVKKIAIFSEGCKTKAVRELNNFHK